MNLLEPIFTSKVTDSLTVEEEMKLNHDIGLTRHNSIRAQANIELLDEKINLIGSLKAHREHCQRLETKLKNLEEQASNLPQVPGVMIETINELKHDVMIFSYPGDFLISVLLKSFFMMPIFQLPLINLNTFNQKVISAVVEM